MIKKVVSLTFVVASLFFAHAAVANQEGQKLAQELACTACHGVDNKIVGPAYKDVAEKYADDPEAMAKIKDSIKNGGVGKWGQVPMPAQPQLTDEQVTILAEWILGLK
ncbi:c-type cytochrome [Pseudidiomarina insulisalsae]|uniref:Cytochrome c-551 n=1 Tax=Pseudidiomarina insulisalsae TaxID=575789 RepID=A0A432YLP6_9GAMM|nr:c-type cytochrome [Pseudidiomarina insulisalsae]RUO61873.1 hypothetical protein CWI71_05820 [Pseudidiomarina insulisalsae]